MAMIEQPAFAKSDMSPFTDLAARIGAAWRALGPWGRRAAITAVGAVFALSCGAAVAGVFRLPTDMKDGAQPEAMTVQDELPSAVAARTYALENPPPYPTAKAEADTPLDATPAMATDDAALTRTAYTGAGDEDQDQVDQADQKPDRQSAESGAAPSSAQKTDD